MNDITVEKLTAERDEYRAQALHLARQKTLVEKALRSVLSAWPQNALLAAAEREMKTGRDDNADALRALAKALEGAAYTAQEVASDK